MSTQQSQELFFQIDPKQSSERTPGTINILYVAPKENASGYYRMVLPYRFLYFHATFDTHVVGLGKEDFSKPFALSKELELDQWAAWADYMIFPMTTQPLHYLCKAFKSIHPKLRLVMDIDTPIHFLSKHDPLSKKLDQKKLESLEQNMLQMDMLTFSNDRLLDAYFNYFLARKQLEKMPNLEYIPTLFTKLHFSALRWEAIEKQKSSDTTIIRIGIITEVRDINEIIALLPVMEAIMEKYPDTVQFVILGWGGLLSDGSKPLQSIAIEYHPAMRYDRYLNCLYNLNLDIAMLVKPKDAYHRLLDHPILLEIAYMGIPAVISKGCMVYEDLFPEDQGLFPQTHDAWIKALTRLIEQPRLRNTLAKTFMENAKEWCTYSQEHITELLEIFN
ncbi:glycosyltransferase [Aquimarina algicola]|uniref:Glycosyltransferase family 1 protein n=1 Tax=Aquimarina algicola TaxID=2589995 RepID=A0A504J4E3_9FLAO|nr:glycosyltransferase [Aquimarina algicola]TPN85826.1 glycosyltransferase family 1 protein [Aquimarina algicola]